MLKFIRRYRVPLLMLLVLPLVGCGTKDNPQLAATLLSVSKIFTALLTALSVIAVVIASLLGKLMSSYFILDGSMQNTLYLTWSVIRNFVNITFVVILLIVAVRVILGFGEDKGLGALKKILPHFIIALVAVNFTFFGARVLLTTSDVLATVVFTLPRSVGGSNMLARSIPCDEKNYANTNNACLDQVASMTGSAFESKTNEANKRSAQLDALFKNTNKSMPMNLVKPGTIPLALLVNILDFKNILYANTINGNPEAFAVSLIGSLVASGAVVLAYLMIFVAFVIRMVVLWVMVALSPVVALAYVLKDVAPGLAEGADGSKLIKKFINYVFMPVYVAVPLSVCMIMIIGNNTVVENGTDISPLSLYSGNLNAILWWVAAVTILWVGTQAAIKQGGELASKGADMIYKGVNKVVGTGAEMLKFAPIVPGEVVGGKADTRISPAGLLSLPDLKLQQMQNDSATRARQIGVDSGFLHPGGENDDARAAAARAGAGGDKNKRIEAFLHPDSAAKIMAASNADTSMRARNELLQSVGISTTPEQQKNMSKEQFEEIVRSNSQKINTGFNVRSPQDLLNQLEAKAKEGGSSSGSSGKESIKTETGVESSSAGTNVIKGKFADNGAKKDASGKEVKVSGQVVHQIEIKDGDDAGKKAYATVDKDGNATIVALQEDVDKSLREIAAKVSESSGNKPQAGNVAAKHINEVIERAGKFGILPGDISADIKKQIRDDIASMLKANQIDNNDMDTVKVAYDKLFTAGKFEDLKAHPN